MKAGEIYVEVKLIGSEKSVSALQKFENAIAKTKSEEKELEKSTIDLTRSASGVFQAFRNVTSSVGDVETTVNSAAGAASNFLGPVGKVAAAGMLAGLGLFKFSKSAGELGEELTALHEMTGFPGELASQYDHAAQKVFGAAGTMYGAIYKLSQMSYQAMMFGTVPPELFLLERLSGKPLKAETVQDPKKLLEYITSALSGKLTGIPNAYRMGLGQTLLGITDPKVMAAIIQGKMSSAAIGKLTGYPEKTIESLKGKGEAALDLQYDAQRTAIIKISGAMDDVSSAAKKVGGALNDAGDAAGGFVEKLGEYTDHIGDYIQSLGSPGPAGPTSIPPEVRKQMEQYQKPLFQKQSFELGPKMPGYIQGMNRVEGDKNVNIHATINGVQSPEKVPHEIYRTASLYDGIFRST